MRSLCYVCRVKYVQVRGMCATCSKTHKSVVKHRIDEANENRIILLPPLPKPEYEIDGETYQVVWDGR